jgi:hypothetical protein
MNDDRILISPTTQAATKEFKLDVVQSNFPQIYATGTLVSGEDIEIQQPDGSGGWNTITYDGSDFVLNVDTNRQSITGCGTFRINKPATTNAVGVSVSRV